MARKTLTDKSWTVAPRMPGVQNGILLTGYDSGNTSLVVGAIDAKPLGGGNENVGRRLSSRDFIAAHEPDGFDLSTFEVTRDKLFSALREP